MEFNNELIEQMKASAIEIIVEGNEQVKIAILLDHGNAGEIVKMKHKNEWVYSYMSEDELYKRITGMSKTNYEMQQEVLMANNNTEQNRFITAYSGSWKGEFKKHYTPADFKKVDSIINTCLNQEVSEETLALYVSLAKVYYILKATEEKPAYEAEELYRRLASSAEDRIKDPAFYFLTKANKGEYYNHLIYADFAAVTGETNPETLKKMAQKKSKEMEDKLSAVPSQLGQN